MKREREGERGIKRKREGERENERDRERKREREREREREITSFLCELLYPIANSLGST